MPGELPRRLATFGFGGFFAISLKDSSRYAATPYHYLFEWDQFYQRPQSHFEELLKQSNMPAHEHLCRDDTGIILFYTLLNKHDKKLKKLYEEDAKDA